MPRLDLVLSAALPRPGLICLDFGLGKTVARTHCIFDFDTWQRSYMFFFLTYLVTEKPPVLFEVRCHGHDITLGGLPWHYIITPYKLRGRFHVCSLSEHQLVCCIVILRI